MSHLRDMEVTGESPGVNVKGGYGAIPENDAGVVKSFRNNFQAHHNAPSVRSLRRHKLNIVLIILLALTGCMLATTGALIWYCKVLRPKWKKQAMEETIRHQATDAALRAEQCRGIDWETACDSLGSAGARRKLYTSKNFLGDRSGEMEEKFLDSDDTSVTYDTKCLRVYRLKLFGDITFPYHSSQLLQAGGNQTMALFIQHGAMRNAPDYFCSFK
jgi:hypothetical protein